MTYIQFLRHLSGMAGAPDSSQAAVARKLGVSPAYLCDILKGRREPGQKILDALGFEKTVRYRRIK